MTKHIINPGDRFGRWTIIKEISSYKRMRRFQCQCDCGTIKNVFIGSLISGKSKSCGCLAHEQAKFINYKNGLYKTRLHCIWQNMVQRCYNSNRHEYPNYGGRGICMCNEWRNDFKSFYDWSMSHGYADNLSIDRINGSGNYEPSNCRWATISQQNCNLRTNRIIAYNGESKPLSEWSKSLGINYKTLEKRVKKWGIEKAFNTPIQIAFRHEKRNVN